jgi:hypothetical protein
MHLVSSVLCCGCELDVLIRTFRLTIDRVNVAVSDAVARVCVKVTLTETH